MTKYLNIAKRQADTTVEGPGTRYGIWTQGCNVGCRSCCNQEMLPFEPRELLTVDSLIEDIQLAIVKYGIDGITLLGGEPTLQAVALADLCKRTKELGLNIWLFSGFRLERLKRMNRAGVDELLRQVDVLVDGPYLPEYPDTIRNWVGSTNQEFHYFTSVYDSSIETDQQFKSSVELRIRSDKTLTLIGSPYLIES